MLPEIRLSLGRLLGAALPLALLALLFLGMALHALSEAREQADWRATPALVAPGIRYSYEIDGRRYTTPPRPLLYQPGDRLTVYVDPDRPTHSVVIPARVRWHTPLVLGVGLWLLVLALGLAFSDDGYLLLHRDGRRALLDRLSGAERRAIQALQKVVDPRRPGALREALQGPLLRETERMVDSLQGHLAPGYLADKTGMSALLFIDMVEEIAHRDRTADASPSWWHWRRISGTSR